MDRTVGILCGLLRGRRKTINWGALGANAAKVPGSRAAAATISYLYRIES